MQYSIHQESLRGDFLPKRGNVLILAKGPNFRALHSYLFDPVFLGSSFHDVWGECLVFRSELILTPGQHSMYTAPT